MNPGRLYILGYASLSEYNLDYISTPDVSASMKSCYFPKRLDILSRLVERFNQEAYKKNMHLPCLYIKFELT